MLEQRQVLDARILVVDDEPANTLLLESILEDEGYRSVRGCNDPREAVALYPEYRPHIVLLDLGMPHMDGYEVMKRIAEHEEGQYVPVLVLTGQQDRDTRLRALAAGAKDFLTKPFDLTEVTLRIRNLIEVRLLYDQLRENHAELETANRQPSTGHLQCGP
ncbi:MAG: response regulator [Candidatus Poribacteria bacterium]